MSKDIRKSALSIAAALSLATLCIAGCAGTNDGAESAGTATSAANPDATSLVAQGSSANDGDLEPADSVDDAPTADGPLKAFPGAEGFGADAEGGRGGKVIQVTNVNDSGEGSLRAALTASGPRTVVFTVGGTIELESRIKITDPYLTVAGQTAPGDGIAVKGNGQIKNSVGLIDVSADHVIIRHIRSRPGPKDDPSKSGNEGFRLAGTKNTILDHVSVSWTRSAVQFRLRALCRITIRAGSRIFTAFR